MESFWLMDRTIHKNILTSLGTRKKLVFIEARSNASLFYSKLDNATVEIIFDSESHLKISVGYHPVGKSIF